MAESDDYNREIKQKVKKLGLEGKVKFWGFVTQIKKFELLARAHVLVNPSVREGWGLVNIEANTMGTPVVAYNSPGLIDSVKDGESGLICDQNLAENMAQLVKRLVNDKKLYLQLAEGAKQWASQFNWEKSRKQSLEIIERYC
jgi:glycosyltransferase involved in cell wall biosynthesis